MRIKNFFYDKTFPANERLWLFCALIFSSGFLGGFTFWVRGKLFVNAQTGNLILLSTGIGTFDKVVIKNTMALLILYFLGVVTAEIFSQKLKEIKYLIWEKTLLIISIFSTLLIGFIPESYPYEFTLYPVAFIVAMQFATFEKAHGMGMATGFCTNHLKQTATNLVRFVRTKDSLKLKTSLSHFSMIVSFVLGTSLAVFLGEMMNEKIIWFITIVYIIIFIIFCKSCNEEN